MKYLINKFIQFKQWILSIVMWRFFIISFYGKRKLLNVIKAKRQKEYLLWSIKCAKAANGLTKKDYPFCACTSAELGIELGMTIDDALDFHNNLNHIVNGVGDRPICGRFSTHYHSCE